MKEMFLKNTVDFLKKYDNYSEEEIEKLKYGLEGIYLTFYKLIVILALSLLLDFFKEEILVLIFFNIIRFTGFGFHADKSWQCLLLSILYFIAIPLFFLNLELSKNMVIIICLICILSYLFFAPADTIKRPLPNKRKRIIRKITTVAMGIVYTLLVFTIPQLQGVLLSSMVIQAILINPLLYKIFGQPFNNYKNFNKA